MKVTAALNYYSYFENSLNNTLFEKCVGSFKSPEIAFSGGQTNSLLSVSVDGVFPKLNP